MSDNRYWGDLHTHCAISYGYGSLERAFKLGREHLDFCSVVGHATWHDMPTDRDRYAFIIDFHESLGHASSMSEETCKIHPLVPPSAIPRGIGPEDPLLRVSGIGYSIRASRLDRPGGGEIEALISGESDHVAFDRLVIH